MTPRTRWSILWGSIGGMTVLVIGVGSRLFTTDSRSLTTISAEVFLVAGITTILSYLLAPRAV